MLPATKNSVCYLALSCLVLISTSSLSVHCSNNEIPSTVSELVESSIGLEIAQGSPQSSGEDKPKGVKDESVSQPACTCAKPNEPIESIAGDETRSKETPSYKPTKTDKKQSSKKYRVITITLPDDSESVADAIIENKDDERQEVEATNKKSTKQQEVAEAPKGSQDENAGDVEVEELASKSADKEKENTSKSFKKNKENEKNKSKSSKVEYGKRSKREAKKGGKDRKNKERKNKK